MAKTSSVFKKVALFFATAAFAAMLVPAVAFASPSIDIYWTASDGTSCSDTVDLADLTASTDAYGTLYYKNNWRVIGTKSSVALSAVFDEAVYGSNDEYVASDVWASGKSLLIKTTDYPNGYTKWTGSFSYDNLSGKYFYGATTATVLDTTNIVPTTNNPYDARIALSNGSIDLADLASGTTANAALTSDYAVDSTDVRLIWGYLDSSNQGGNRFPDKITSITIQ